MSYMVRASDSPGFFPLSLQSGLFAEMVSEDGRRAKEKFYLLTPVLEKRESSICELLLSKNQWKCV